MRTARRQTGACAMTARANLHLLLRHLEDVRREMPDASWMERDREVQRRMERAK